MMTKVLSVALAVFLITGAFSGCSGKVSEQEKMPDIVFYCRIDRSLKMDNGGNRITDTFCTSDGEFYRLEDDEICSENFLSEIISMYTSGELNDYIELINTVDEESVKLNYELLKKAANNKNIAIDYPEWSLDVCASVFSWYGVTIDNNNELRLINLHCTDNRGSCYSNDDNANQIYEWYESVAPVGEPYP